MRNAAKRRCKDKLPLCFNILLNSFNASTGFFKCSKTSVQRITSKLSVLETFSQAIYNDIFHPSLRTVLFNISAPFYSLIQSSGQISLYSESCAHLLGAITILSRL